MLQESFFNFRKVVDLDLVDNKVKPFDMAIYSDWSKRKMKTDPASRSLPNPISAIPMP